MEEAVVAYLLANTTLAGLLGNRINWNTRPQGSQLPAIVLQRVSGTTDYTMDGPSGLKQSRVQIDCWAKTYGSSVAVSRAVKSALSGLRADLGSTNIQGAFVDNERQSFEQGAGGEEFHRVSIDLILNHLEN